MGILERLSPSPSVGTDMNAETTTLRSPATWFLEALGLAKDSASGVRVSEAVAMGLSAYYCGVSMIARTIASLPLNVYKRDGRKREIWDKSPAHGLLHNQPNPHMTAMSLRQTWLLHAIGRGNAYGEIVWDGRGRPAAIWPSRSEVQTIWASLSSWSARSQPCACSVPVTVAGRHCPGMPASTCALARPGAREP